MCGIIGYIGPNPPVPIIIEGLRRLEYRGYDSAGIAVAGGPQEFCRNPFAEFLSFGSTPSGSGMSGFGFHASAW